MNRSALACAAIAAVIIVTACGGPDAVPEAPIETVSNHATVCPGAGTQRGETCARQLLRRLVRLV